MSNIRDLQRLRGNKNLAVLAHTNYAFTPTLDLRKSHLPSSRSPLKGNKDTEDTSRSPTKNAHRRGESFGFGEGNGSLLLRPRVSLYP